MSNPKKWTEVYPYGTKEGDEEARFFKELARHPKWDYRSTSQLIKSTGLSKERIEEIISKYAENYTPPLVYPHPSNDDHWGYWERCPDQVKTDYRGISRKDKDQRIDKQLNGVSPSTTGVGGASVPTTVPSQPSIVVNTSVPPIVINVPSINVPPINASFPPIIFAQPPVAPKPTTPSVTYMDFDGHIRNIHDGNCHDGVVFSLDVFENDQKYQEMRDGVHPSMRRYIPSQEVVAKFCKD